MQLFSCWESFQPFVPMEEHEVENEAEVVSLDTVLDVICEVNHQKRKCTFDRICVSVRRQNKDISKQAIERVLEQAVTEKVVVKRVTDDISSYKAIKPSKNGSRRKPASSKPDSLALVQLSDAVVSTFSAEASNNSKKSLSLKCIEEKIISEGRLQFSEEFDWSQNVRIVCRQLATQGVLQRQGSQYHLVDDAGCRQPTASCSSSQTISELAGCRRGQKRNSIGCSKGAHVEDTDASRSDDRKRVSNSYHVIGEVFASNVMHKAHKYRRVCNTVRKVVMKRKTPQTVLRRARGVDFKKSAVQKPRILSRGKNLHRKKYRLRSSVEQVHATADESVSRHRKLLKGCRRHGLSSSVEGKMRSADSREKNAVKDGDSSSAFCVEKFKKSSHSLISRVHQCDKGSSDSERGSAAARSTRNRARNYEIVSSGDAEVAENCLPPVSLPVVDLCRIESQPAKYDERMILVCSNSDVTVETNGKNSYLGSTRKIPAYQLASSEPHESGANVVKKTFSSLATVQD